MTQHDDATISDWLAAGQGRARTEALDAALAAARSTRQRPAWAVTLTDGNFAERGAAVSLRHGIIVLAALALVGGWMVGLRLVGR